MRMSKGSLGVLLLSFLFLTTAAFAHDCPPAGSLSFPVTLSGTQFGGQGSPAGFGSGLITLNPQNNTATVDINTTGLGPNINSAGLFNNGTNVLTFTSPTNRFDNNGNFNGTVAITPALMNSILANPGAFTFNVGTSEFPNGAVTGSLRNGTSFGGTFSGTNVVGSTGATNGGGAFTATIAPNANGSGSTLFFSTTPTGIGTSFTGLSLSQGGVGAPGTPFVNLSTGGTLTNGRFTGSVPLTTAQTQALMANPSNFFVTTSTSQFPSGAVRAQLGTSTNELWLPIVGSVRGAGGNQWTTDIRIYNTSSTSPATASFELFPLGGTNVTAGNTMNPLSASTVVIPAGATNSISNIALNIFSNFNGIGAVRITSDQPLVAYARIYDANGDAAGHNLAASAQPIPAKTICDTLARGVLIGLSSSGNPASTVGVRSNAGFFNPNPVPVTVQAKLSSANGSAVGQQSFTLQPYASMLMPLLGNSGLFSYGADLTDAVMTYQASAPLFAYSSVTSNATGDTHVTFAVEDKSQPAVAFSDLAAIVTAANQGEVQEGQLAATNATSAAVRQFAQQMVTDHTAALTNAQSVFSQLGITAAANNRTALTLQQQTQQELATLGTLSGTAFDRTYMQEQVNDHQAVLSMLDSMLLPSAGSTPQLTTLLQSMRATVAQHLANAQTILSTLP